MILLLSSIVVTLYVLFKLLSWYINGNNDYWPKKGVPLALATEFASYYQILSAKVKFRDIDLYTYNKYKDTPFVGIMEMRNPVLQVRDLELIKRIFIKDFDYFVNRRSVSLGNELSDSFLFNMTSQPWKDLRSLMSPTFTSGKIRRMFQHIDKSGTDLIKYIEIKNQKGALTNGVELRELFGRYTMDVISSSAFGMDSHCLLDDESIFLKMGKKFQALGFGRTFNFFMLVFLPGIAKLIGVSFFDATAISFFKKVVQNNIKHREGKNSGDGDFHSVDFLQLMLESRKQGNANDANTVAEEMDTFEKDAQLTTSNSKSTFKLTDDMILANSVTFFLAGFDTTESLMTFATYHLAVHPEMQERLRNEILSCTKVFGGRITYEAINKMQYLDMFMAENLRLYPPAIRTERKVEKPYRIPDTDITLPANLIIAFPILGIHRDEKYYPEPEKFDPERFSPENKAQRNPYAYMPFGHGPRNCIGMRFALFETKAAIAHLVKNFEISPCADTPIPIVVEEVSGNMKPASGLKVSFKPL